jgi:hypothetical protein
MWGILISSNQHQEFRDQDGNRDPTLIEEGRTQMELNLAFGNGTPNGKHRKLINNEVWTAS